MTPETTSGENHTNNQGDKLKATTQKAGSALLDFWEDTKGAILIAVIILVTISVFRTFIMNNYTVPSASMENTLGVGDTIIVNKMDTTPDRGDVVIFHQSDWPAPDDAPSGVFGTMTGLISGDLNVTYVKRVLGVPGDTIGGCGPDGLLMINGEQVVENYIATNESGCNFPEVTLGQDQYWMMGDNRENSADSRIHAMTESGHYDVNTGAVPAQNITGTVVTDYTPLSTLPILNLVPGPS